MNRSYRHPREQFILALTLGLVFVVIAISSAATLCSSALFVLAMLAFSFFMNRSHHQELIARAHPVTAASEPELDRLVDGCVARLGCEPVHTYIAPLKGLNAYTFGMTAPRVVVLYANLFNVMDADELRFILGHELGHVRLGHTWLNSLVGGMSGIPSPYGAAIVLYFSFRWWNRACEISADRAGLLACGKPDKAASALIKLAGGFSAANSPEDMQAALRRIEAQDDSPGDNLRELLSTHPAILRRLEDLRKYAASAEYRNLQAQVDAAHPLPS